MKHCCHGISQWMSSCHWWQVLWNGPPDAKYLFPNRFIYGAVLSLWTHRLMNIHDIQSLRFIPSIHHWLQRLVRGVFVKHWTVEPKYGSSSPRMANILLPYLWILDNLFGKKIRHPDSFCYACARCPGHKLWTNGNAECVYYDDTITHSRGMETIVYKYPVYLWCMHQCHFSLTRNIVFHYCANLRTVSLWILSTANPTEWRGERFQIGGENLLNRLRQQRDLACCAALWEVSFIMSIEPL